jgi:hypothetical protein
MTWTTVALIFVAWCLVAVAAGLVFGKIFRVMNGTPNQIGGEERGRVGRHEGKVSRRYPRRRVKARSRAGAAYRPAPVGGAPDPPLDAK